MASKSYRTFDIQPSPKLKTIFKWKKIIDPWQKYTFTQVLLAASVVYHEEVSKTFDEGKPSKGRGLLENAFFWQKYKQQKYGHKTPLKETGFLGKQFRMFAPSSGAITEVVVGIPPGKNHPNSNLSAGELAEKLESGWTQPITPKMREMLNKRFLIPLLGAQLRPRKRFIFVKPRPFRKRALLSSRNIIRKDVNKAGKEAVGFMKNIIDKNIPPSSIDSLSRRKANIILAKANKS